MSKLLKWIGGGLGWAAGGPIGAILGFALGAIIESLQTGIMEYKPYTNNTFETPQTTSKDFYISLLILASVVMKADKKLMRSELDYIKNFLIQQFGISEAERQMPLLRELLKQEYNTYDVCLQIRQYMEYQSRLQLLHFLFGVAGADSQVNERETSVISTLASQLGISTRDFESIKAMFVKDTKSAYNILGIPPEATNDEVKKAYRLMAIKYHPDKVAHLGPEVQQAAKVKFQEMAAAYEEIKKERGMV